MYKPVVSFLTLLFIVNIPVPAQKISSKPQFIEGKTILVTIEVDNNLTQQAGAQAVKFLAKGSATHNYKVTQINSSVTTLHHAIQRVNFQFEGMGQKRVFDSDNPDDKKGQFGPLFEEVLSKSFDITIDSTGKTINAVPDKITLGRPDERIVIITDMLKDLTQVIYPPKKGTGSFFYVLPAGEKKIGDSWTETNDTENEKSTTSNTLSAVTDSTIIVDYKTTASSVIKSEIMGRQTKTNLNNTTTGKIIVDRATGIIREKTSSMDVNGTTEAMGGTVPISGKTFVKITVSQ